VVGGHAHDAGGTDVFAFPREDSAAAPEVVEDGAAVFLRRPRPIAQDQEDAGEAIARGQLAAGPAGAGAAPERNTFQAAGASFGPAERSATTAARPLGHGARAASGERQAQRQQTRPAPATPAPSNFQTFSKSFPFAFSPWD
jgi:hypothetical protein